MPQDTDLAVPAKVARVLEKEGGRLAIAYDHHRAEWVVGLEFGQEADDSDMAGGAAYGTGDTYSEAMAQAAGDLG